MLGSLVQTGFILYFRPYKEKTVLLSNIAGEICTTCAMGLIYSFMFINSQKISAKIEQAALFIILSGMAFQIIISVFITIQAFITIWKKIEKQRALGFLRNTRNSGKSKFTLK